MRTVQTPVAEPSASQRCALDTILSSVDGSFVIVGLGGSGKTHTLTLLERELRADGHSVLLITGPQLSGTKQDAVDAISSADEVLIDDADRANGPVLSELIASRRASGRRTVLTRDPLRAPPDLSDVHELGLSAWSPEELKRASTQWNHASADSQLITLAGGSPGLLRWALEHRITATATLVTRDALTSVPMLSGLTRDQVEILKAGTLAGDTFRIEAIAHGLNLTWVELADHAAWLLNGGILVSRDVDLAFTHPLLAEVLRGSVSIPERRSRSRAIAKALLHSAEEPELACQYIVAAEWYSVETLSWLTTSVSHLIVRRPETLVPLLEGFLARLPPDHVRRPEIQTWLAQCLFQLGRASDVEKLVHQSLRDGHAGSAEVPLRLNLSGALLLGNNVAEALNVLNARSPIDVTDEGERNTLRAVRSLHRVFAGDLARGESEAVSAAETGRLIGDTLGVSVALSTLSHVAYYEGDVPRAIDLASQAVENADRSGSHEAARRSRYELGMFNLHADRVDEAREIFESEARRSEEDTTSKWYRPLPLIGLGLIDYQLGHWDSAESRLEEALRYGEEVSTRWESAYVRSHLSDMAVKRGDVTHALAQLELIEHRPDDTAHHSLDAVLWARATVATALNRSDEALDLLAEAAALVQQYSVVTRYRWLVPQVLRTARQLDRVAEFAWLVEELDEVARRSEVSYIHGAAQISRALLHGEPDTALRAVELLRESRRLTDLADALADAGKLLCDAGRTGDAVAYFEEARDLYGTFGATAAHAKVKSELRTLGVSTAATTRRKKPPVEGPESLTPAERRIVGFVAQGLSNAEIAQHLYISPRTVETHLTRCYSKLGVTSRVALAMFATSQVR